MKKLSYLFFVFSSILMLSCAVQQPAVGPVQDDGKIDFTFLQLNDVYEIAPLEGGRVGGLARVEYVHKELIKENKNTYLFMAGDFLNPSLLGALKYDGQRIRGKQMIEVMNAMNFDLVAFGNHEFDLNKNELQQRLNESTFPFTSANVRYKFSGETFPFYKEQEGLKNFVSDTHIIPIKDIDGTEIKLGFFSVTIPSNPQSYVAYTDIYTEALRAYEILSKKADVVFGLTHLTLDQDKRILALLKEVPLIMGGHEHNNMLVSVGDSKVAKADANAKTIYIHRIHYNKITKSLEIKSELKSITDQTPHDKKVDSIVSKWNSILNKEIKQIIENPYETIYTSSVPLDGRDTQSRSTQTNLGGIITRAMAFGFDNQVDGALVNGGSIRLDDQLTGNINGIDIFRVLPFGGGVLKVQLKGSLLKEILEFGNAKAGKGAYLQRYLLDFDENSNLWHVKGEPINATQIYTIAFSDYLLRGRDIPFLTTDNKGVISVHTPSKDSISYDIRKAIINYLKSLE